MKNVTLHFVVASLAVHCASAIPSQIQPTFYQFARSPDNGTYTYQDSGGELTDGFLGGSLTSQDAANPWVAWNGSDPLINIDFTFDGGAHFNEVKVGTLQSGISDIPLPSADLYTWNTSLLDWEWLAGVDNAPEDPSNNGLHFITLTGFGVESSLLRVALRHAVDGPWTFTDEIQFFGEEIISPNGPGTNVPEAASTGILLGLSALGLGMLKRKR